MKILLIQLRAIGDVLMTTPAVRAIRKKFPDATIHYLTEYPSNEIFINSPYINEVIAIKRKRTFMETFRLFKRIRNEKYDIVIDFFGNPTSAQITFFSGAKDRYGFAFRGRKYAYNHLTDINKPSEPGFEYSIYHKLSVIEPLGIKPDGEELDFFITDKDREYVKNLFDGLGVKDNDFLVALGIASVRAYKVWHAENFAKVADYLIEKYNAKILFIYGPNEEHFVRAVSSKMKNTPLPEYNPHKIAHTRAIFERADIYISNDNGPRHMAISAGIPTVGVFSCASPLSWTPRNNPKHITLQDLSLCPREKHDKHCNVECFNKVTAQDVINAAEILIKKYIKK